MTETPEIVELETIAPTETITISFNADLYIGIQRVLLEGLAFKDYAHFQKCLQEVTKGDMKDPMASHVLTLLRICSLIEESAKKDNLIKKTKFDIKASKVVE